MSEISSNIILVILITSLATYLSRFLGVVSSEKMDIKSKIFRWFNCIAYAILAALIARMVIFPAGVLAESSILIRFFDHYVKKNLFFTIDIFRFLVFKNLSGTLFSS